LPFADGTFLCQTKEGIRYLGYYPFSSELPEYKKEYWLSSVDWYFLPVQDYTRNIELLAKFFSMHRIEDDPDLNKLFDLDDMYDEVYKKDRNGSFYVAQINGFKKVIKYCLTS
jgi:hypothetical protein